MNPTAFLDVAYLLLEGESEAEWRSAVSRGYYAAFHVARQLLNACGFVMPLTDPHAFIIRRLSNAKYPEVVEAGWRFSDLRANRNWADYDLDNPISQNTAGDLLLTAAKIIEMLQLVAQEPAVKAKITEAIKTYERDVLRQVTWKQ